MGDDSNTKYTPFGSVESLILALLAEGNREGSAIRVAAKISGVTPKWAEEAYLCHIKHSSNLHTLEALWSAVHNHHDMQATVIRDEIQKGLYAASAQIR